MLSNTRFAALLTVIVILALLAGTWFVGIGPRLAEVAAADNERATVEGQNAAHQAELDRLIGIDANLSTLEAELAELRLAIPGTPETSVFYRQLDAIAAATGVRFTDISLTNVAAYETPEAVVIDDGAEAEAEVDQIPGLAEALAAVSADNFLIIDAQFGLAGSYAGVMDALSMLQTGERFVLVSGLNIEEGLRGPDEAVSANFTGQLFVLLDSTGVAPAAEATPEAAPAA
ncbi:hypothetical protein FB562_2501 [Homoserinimonas aerilata]|uniref:Tfp pilus assembly protein PilO n=1 Tax=Homoserinimonas aerilata TaxID=1162970 RepID=A0A542Y1G7_9MICO|nr:hypothetical protein [Homoserinimonas aerilata]TQL41915.1 hypothetical protein FB562_2501 [Homoserinimonas aerilata]